MKRLICGLSALAVMACWSVVPAWAQSGEHKMVKAKELKWADVPSLPKGAQATVIEGPMNEAVPFTVRIKFPANYRLPAHWHPAVERVTVLSGEFHMGMGEKFDAKKVMGLKQGDMMIMQPKTAPLRVNQDRHRGPGARHGALGRELRESRRRSQEEEIVVAGFPIALRRTSDGNVTPRSHSETQRQT